MGSHDGAVAIVTGASRGIGLGIAERLVAEGARVVVTARKAEAIAEAVDRLGGPAKALGIAGNAADVTHQDEVISAARDTFGGLDYLVNNTGINPVYGPILDSDLEAARKIMEVNVLSAFSWTQKAVAAGLGGAGTPGAIVNVASIAGLGATGAIGWYAVSKAALIHLTVELGYQLGPEVRVNAVAPGFTLSDAQLTLTGNQRDWYEANKQRQSLPERNEQPEDLAGPALFLASEDSDFMTGQTLLVDGGQGMH
jgi:NAD(P)-dependent dehydrogenase (short-subunit alcohol dehydrogenase family)